VSPRPGDLIRFDGIIGEDRGFCLVVAVQRVPGALSVLFLTPRCTLMTRELVDGSVLALGVDIINDD